MSVFDEILDELRSSDAYDAKLAERASAELAELREYKRLYDEVAKLLNSANFKLSEISRLAHHEPANTGLQADWATVAVCPNCKSDYDVEQTMCISCGRPTAKA